MHLVAEVESLTESQLLDHAGAVARQQRRCEVQMMRIAVQHAIIHNSDRLDPDVSRLPGRERARVLGGPGTPRVTSFAPATLGAVMGVSTTAAVSLIADSLDLVMRLPRLWTRVEALEVKASYARHVARRTRDLPFEQADMVDEAVAEVADGRVPWTRFEQIVDGAIVASDPAAAAERERAERSSGYARRTRSTQSGMAGFQIRAPFPVVTLLDARVAWFAEVLKVLGDERTLDERRVAAVALLANPPTALELMRRFQQWRDRPQDPPMPAPDDSGDPGDADGQTSACASCGHGTPSGPEPANEVAPKVDWSAVLPTVRLFLHFYPGREPLDRPAAGGDPPGRDPTAPPPRWRLDRDVGAVVRAEGQGPVTPEWVREFLGKDARFTITPVLDLAGQAPVDAYEIPVRHREAVHLMSPADIFPWGTSTSRSREIDHTIPYLHGLAARGAAQSRIGNYGPMSRHHHRVKTHGGWDVQQPFPGIYVWRDPYGRFFLVDHTGARRVPSLRGLGDQPNVSRVKWRANELIVDYERIA